MLNRVLEINGRGVRCAVLTAAALALGLGIFAGCTSDQSNPVGTVIPPELDLIDPTLVTMKFLENQGTVTIVDDDHPFDLSEVLYLGFKGDEASSILLSYDFSGLQDSVGADVTISPSTITSVTMYLYRTLGYADVGQDDDDSDATKEIFPGWKNFEIWSLADTLATSAYPGIEPATADFITSEDDGGEVISINIPEGDFIDWWETGRADLMIRAGASSEEGLIGYASRDLQLNSQHPRALAGTTVGVTVSVTITDSDDIEHVIVFPATKDVSTFHQLDEPGDTFTDGFMLRTHFRRYPWLRFNLDALPDNILINRAILRCAMDTLAGYGPLEAAVVSEIALAAVSGVDTLQLADLEDAVSVISGQTNLDPTYIAAEQRPWVGFNVTSAIQRHVNGVTEDETCLILTAGEDVFSNYDVVLWDPEFYLTRFQFLGTGDPDFAPYLEVTYTIFSGGQ